MEEQAEQHQKWWQQMEAMFRSLWKQIKHHRVAIVVVAIVLVVVITLFIAGYWFDWTGFNGYNKVTTTHTISGTNAGTVTRTEEYQPGKGLWDWLQLLIIPILLAIGGYWFNQIQRDRDQKAAEAQKRSEESEAKEREKLERESREDNQRETALQAYLDKMSELLLHANLRGSAKEDEVRKIARVLTLTILSRLDANRKRSVLQFLHESRLIEKGKRIIYLGGANLGFANLGFANLSFADLSFTYLSGADLSGANLRGTDLSGANLSGANLSGADLSGAMLIEADLSRAKLIEADLGRAMLIDFNPSGADLSRAKLIDANLSRANLSNDGNLTQQQLDQVYTCQGATLPHGLACHRTP